MILPVNVSPVVFSGIVYLVSADSRYNLDTLSLTTSPVSGSTCHPITLAPDWVTSAPASSLVKFPALVKNVSPPLLTIKNALAPVIARSVALSVLSVEPSDVIDVDIAPTDEPRPICFALVPPLPVVALGPVAVCVV